MRRRSAKHNPLEDAITHEKPAVQNILRATLRCLVDKDAESLSMREIAEAAGVSKSLLHYHFHSKEELLLELQDRLINTLILGVKMVTDVLAETEGGAATLVGSFDAIWHFLRNAGDAQAIALRLAGQGTVDPTIHRRLMKFRTRLAKSMTKGIERSLGKEMPAGFPLEAAGELALACLFGLEVQRFFAEDKRALDKAFELLKQWFLIAQRAEGVKA